MKQEDLRAARLIEAKRRWIEDETPRREVEHLADLYETNWTPPEPVSDDLLAAREWCAMNSVAPNRNLYRTGRNDGSMFIRAYLAGCTRGREGAKGLVEALEKLADLSDRAARCVNSTVVRNDFLRELAEIEAALASAKRGV